MLGRSIVLLGLLLSFNTLAIERDAQMNAALAPFYRALESREAAASLLGREFTLNLSLKFASERHLIFHDAYVRVDSTERYQIAKWQFEPEVVASVQGMSEVECAVTFIVDEIRTTAPYTDMPHILVRVINVVPLPLPLAGK